MNDEVRDPADEFDEAFYLATHPDVAAAVRNGQFESGRDHFLQFGRREGRRTRANDFGFSGCGVLNVDPLVVHLWWFRDDPFQAIGELANRLRDTPFICLVSNGWSLVSRFHDFTELVDVAASYRRHRSMRANHRVVFLANDLLEKKMLEWQGIESVVFQHNGFFGADSVARSSASAREWDAIYVARIGSYKRLELMTGIEAGCVVFAGVDEEYLQRIWPSVRHLRFANGDPRGKNHRLLSREEVAEWCSRSHCGLCLSDEEGAMFASAEYLLCGLPIVSTPSLGGRDAYFAKDYCAICEPDAAAVARAVGEMKGRRLSPDWVRSETLKLILRNRIDFLDDLSRMTRSSSGQFESMNRSFLDIAYRFDFLKSWTVSTLLDEIRRQGLEPD